MRNSLRKALDGYDKLKAKGKIADIFDLKQDLTTKEITCIHNKASKLIFGAGVKKAELITRQYLLLLWGGLELNKQLLSSYAEPEKESVYILPKEWRLIINSYGIKIANLKSYYAWNKYLLGCLLRCYNVSFRVVIKTCLQLFKIHRLSKTPEVSNYAFFCYLNRNNIPEVGNIDDSHNIISWYISWLGKDKEITTVCHNVTETVNTHYAGIDIKYIDGPVLPFFSAS